MAGESQPRDGAGIGRSARARAARDRLRRMARPLVAMREDVALARREGADGRNVLADRLDRAHRELAQRLARLSEGQDRLLAGIQAAVDREPDQRERLGELRATPGYEAAFDDETPLISVVIPTYDEPELLRERALPSALSQTHERIEVIVVGDAAPAAVAEAVESVGDHRVRFHNLGMRGPYPDDGYARWMVAGVPPFNAGVRMARGSWIAPLDDDDAFSPDHVERLLEHARAQRAELVYGTMREHRPGGATARVGEFPPRHTEFAIQAAMYHAGLAGIFELELSDAVFGIPYDWSLCRRMMRAGVRVSMLDADVVDYYPSRMWARRERVPWPTAEEADLPAPAAASGPAASQPEWEIAPEGVAAAQDAEAAAGAGWSVDAVAEAYAGKWPGFLEALTATGPLGVPHEVPEGVAVPRDDPGAHNIVLSFGHVLGLAARGGRELSILDWGGAYGHYREFALRLYDDLVLDYHCRELPAVCAAGREVSPEVNFVADDSCLERTYDLVLASGALQYERDWEGLLGRLAAAASPWLYVTRLPVVQTVPSFAARQRAHAYGYDTEYVGWVLNRGEVIAAGERAGLELVREYALIGPMRIEGAPEHPRHVGFLWRSPARTAST